LNKVLFSILPLISVLVVSGLVSSVYGFTEDAVVYIGPRGLDHSGALPLCPPKFMSEGFPLVPTNTDDINEDGTNDWIIGAEIALVEDPDGSVHVLTHLIYCLNKGEKSVESTWSSVLAKGWKESGQSIPTITVFGPTGSVDDAPEPSCPFDFGINIFFYGTAGADGLPSSHNWYSKDPMTKEIQITTFDTEGEEFSQTRVGPGDEGYPPEKPPDVSEEFFQQYLIDDPPTECKIDQDNDGLLDIDELEQFTDSFNPDTDGDGISDFDEIELGSLPTFDLSVPEDLSFPGTCNDLSDNDFDLLTDGADPGCVDSDIDTIPDSRDNCILVPNTSQRDFDGDGLGAECDPDDDNDFVLDPDDLCPETRLGVLIDATGCPAPDLDGDGVPDSTDNCSTIFNPTQTNHDVDAMGDACDPNTEIIANTVAVDTTFGGDLTVDSATFTIPSGITVNFDFVNNKILIKSPGGKILIESGGKIT